jgi:hypothetical protein
LGGPQSPSGRFEKSEISGAGSIQPVTYKLCK